MYTSYAKSCNVLPRGLVFVISGLLSCVLSPTMIAADTLSASKGKDGSVDIDDRFYTNTVLSTSLDTPGAARAISVDDTRIVRGRILSADGKPTENAEVWGISLTALPPIRERTKTDADGKYQLDLLPNTNWLVKAFKNNESVDVTRETPWNSLDRVTTLADAQLNTGCTAKCEIIDQEHSQAISDARIYLDDGRVLVSDSVGNADMSGLKAGNHDAIILARGFEIKHVTFHCLNDDQNHLQVLLRPASAITGQVVNEIETPLSHAWLARSTKIMKSLAADGTYLLTDEQGEFIGPNNPLAGSSRMQDLLDHQMTIVRAGAYDYVSKSVDSMVDVSKLAKPLNIVLREQPGQPPQNSSGTLNTPGGDIRFFSFSPTNEQPSEEELNGTNALEITRAQEMLKARVVHADEPDDLFGGFLRKDEPKTKVERRVVNLEGKPIEGARIEPLSFFDSVDDGMFSKMFGSKDAVCFSDKQGKFSISSSPMDGPTLILSHESYASRIIEKSMLIDKEEDVQMEPKRFVRAKVVDELGHPIRGFKITVKPLGIPSSIPGYRPPEFFESVTLHSVSHEGNFAYHNQWHNSGRFQLVIRAEGFMDCLGEVSVDADHDGAPVFVMKKPSTLKINVSSAAIDPTRIISNVTLATLPPVETENKSDPLLGLVRCVPDSARIIDTTNQCEVAIMQSRGAFAIEATGFARQFFDWQSSTSEYDVKLVPESIIAGSIESDLANHPPLTLWLTCVYDRYSIRIPATKEFQIPNLSSGWYRLRLVQDNQTLITSNVFLKTGGRVDFRLKILEDGQVKLNDRKESGNILSDDVQFSVNGKPQRLTSADDYLSAIKSRIAEKSEALANQLTKQFLFDLLRKRIDQIKSNPNEMQYMGSQIHAMQSLIDNEQWPVGIEYIYCDPKFDQGDKPYLVLCIPTPESETLDEKLIFNF